MVEILHAVQDDRDTTFARGSNAIARRRSQPRFSLAGNPGYKFMPAAP
jgi:hypothetical protein